MSAPTVDLTNCDREPIHIPGAIQPHGALLVCRAADLVVEQASANLEHFVGRTAASAVGAPLASLFADSSAAELHAVARAGGTRESGARVVSLADGRTLDATIHRSGSGVVVELEPHTADAGGYLSRLRPAVARLNATTEVLDLCVIAASEVQKLTGFDRVMVYRFDRDWHGEVVAEAKRDDLEPFLGLHYPASDIPAQARRLYTLNWLRLIADARYLPVPLHPAMRAGDEPLDMSHCVLRSVSPIHCEYLTNMGVRASMSISLLRDGELWGLIACHHYQGPKVVPLVARDSAEFLAQTLSWHVATRERADAMQRARDAAAVEADLVQSMSLVEDFARGLATPSLLALTKAEGAAVLFEGELHLVGRTPSADATRDLIDWMSGQLHDGIFVTDRLASARGAAGEDLADLASGALAVAISEEHREFVVWFRPSTERVVSWAGNPDKTVDAAAPRLSPRGSFSLWLESVRGRSLPWEPWEIAAASNLRRAILGGVRRRAASLRVRGDRLEEADRMKDAFIATVSHELRTPLNAIAGWARILRQRTSPEKYAHALEVIERNARTQTQLIDDLLDVSRMTTGKLALQVEPVDLVGIIEGALESVSLAADARSVRVRPVLDSRASVILGDAKRLQQVVWNLMTNAIKFTPKGGHIEVSLRRVSSDVELAVTDSGEGIDAALLPHVFDAFRQGAVADRRGLGLGLAISRHIVELHGGRIVAESAGAGQGATFRVRLPLSAVLPLDHADAPHAVVGTRDGAVLLGIHAVVVEDEDDSRDLLVELLTQWGATVEAFADAPSALAAIPRARPDVIVADIGLPGMDGHELIRAVRRLAAAEGGTAPAVAITAFARSRDRTQALVAGFQSYVPKPVDAEELLVVLLSLLGRTPTPL